MQGKEDRQRAQEANFVRKEEDKFMRAARAAHQLGLWAAEHLGKTGQDAEAFAREIRTKSVLSGQEAMLAYVTTILDGVSDEATVARKFSELNA